jgi:hypothetical protein
VAKTERNNKVGRIETLIPTIWCEWGDDEPHICRGSLRNLCKINLASC